jgi:uncharacterized HAD superfamily protein
MVKPILAVDIDNTIADTNGTMLGFMPGLEIEKYPAPGINQELFNQNPWIFTDTLPIKGAAEGVNYLSAYWKIVYLTARPECAEGLTYAWLKQHWFPESLVICTDNKPEWILKLGISLAIDDSPKEIMAISKLIPVCIYEQPYNKELSHIGYRFTWSSNWVKNIMAYNNMLIA